MGFKVLYLKELQSDLESVDSRVLILYDETVNNLFYYGTRKISESDKYSDFSGYYHYNRIDTMASFIFKLVGECKYKITMEVHDVIILNTEYSSLSFTTLVNKLSRHTELFAYDSVVCNRSDIFDWISMLIQHSK